MYNIILLFSGVHNQQLLVKLHLSIIQLLVDCIPALKTSQSLVQVKTSPGATGQRSQSPQTPADNTQTTQGEGVSGENSGGEGVSPQTEEEENQNKIQELLVVFEKKLQSSLMALIKIQSSAKSSKKG